MADALSTTIIRDGLEEIPLLVPDTEGVWIKVLKADEEQGRVIVKTRFEPGGHMPRHTHHCQAVAYTLSGEWDYDNGRFGPGDIAYETRRRTSSVQHDGRRDRSRVRQRRRPVAGQPPPLGQHRPRRDLVGLL